MTKKTDFVEFGKVTKQANDKPLGESDFQFCHAILQTKVETWEETKYGPSTGKTEINRHCSGETQIMDFLDRLQIS